MKTNLTRGQKLLYSFLFTGCVLTVMAVDDRPEVDEINQEQVEWTVEMAAQQLELERQNKPHPQMIGEPAFEGKPNWDNQYAWLRKQHEMKKGIR